MALHLEIVTPDQVVLKTEADYVGAPGVDGQFGVLSGHIPLLTALDVGNLYYRLDGKEHNIFVAGGFLEVLDDKVTVLAQSSELACNIDENRADLAKKRAEERLSAKKEGVDLDRAEFALKKAITRLNISHRK